MEHINKVKRKFFLSELDVSDGGISKLEHAWLKEITDLDKATPDMWFALFKQNGVSNLMDYLKMFGYTEGINKALASYYNDRPGFVLNLTTDLDLRGI